MTPKEKTENFHKEFKNLLKKYDAEVNIENVDISGYSSDYKMVIYFNYDEVLGIIPELILDKYEDGSE